MPLPTPWSPSGAAGSRRLEFAAATLNHEKDTTIQLKLLRELAAEGIDYVPVDARQSIDKWTIGHDHNGKRTLIGPLTNVKGIAAATLQIILRCRKTGEPLPKRIQKLLSNAQTPLDSLFPIAEAFRRLLPDPRARNIHREPIGSIEQAAGEQRFVLFCTPSKITQIDENEPMRVKRRGGRRFEGKTAALNLTLADDSGDIFTKIDRDLFDAGEARS
jgi:hypothetical protein